MLKEDSDAALLRIFECFLEAAPQQVLQTSLLLRAQEEFAGKFDMFYFNLYSFLILLFT